MGLVEQYERNQSFNPINTWLHSLRYRHLISLLSEIPQPFRLLDIGCATAKLYDIVDRMFRLQYIGVELDDRFSSVAAARHVERSNFTLMAESIVTAIDRVPRCDIVCALETMEHMPREDVCAVLDKIAAMRPMHFVCSVPVEVGPAIWLKNVGSALCRYSRHHEYSWRETFWAGLYRLDKLPPHDCGHRGFDWRWLANEVRARFRGVRVSHFPFGILPGALSTSVFISSRSTAT